VRSFGRCLSFVILWTRWYIFVHCCRSLLTFTRSVSGKCILDPCSGSLARLKRLFVIVIGAKLNVALLPIVAEIQYFVVAIPFQSFCFVFIWQVNLLITNPTVRNGHCLICTFWNNTFIRWKALGSFWLRLVTTEVFYYHCRIVLEKAQLLCPAKGRSSERWQKRQWLLRNGMFVLMLSNFYVFDLTFQTRLLREFKLRQCSMYFTNRIFSQMTTRTKCT